MMSHKIQKNSLTISLAESLVFQRNIDGRRRGLTQPNDASPNSLLRGLLILDLCRPTRISSIELELTGKAKTSWPQVVGSRRVDITEEHEIFNASTVFFRAGSTDTGAGDGWKEFKKGVYTYPISFMIPGNAPPTLESLHGNVTWRLKGQVHRPGTFNQKLSASREVILVASPREDDTENIIVHRQWNLQMQYMISVSARSFHIGGTLPIQITILPMTKMKVHRISVILEERTDYYSGADSTRIARTDFIRSFSLLSLEVDSKKSGPTFLIPTDDPEIFKRSPKYKTVVAEGELSEAASSLMGPGPWTFQRDLALPTSCTQIHFSNKNRRANILITHTLKVVFRAERGDNKFVDQKTGKQRLFDVVVEMPINILSCRCIPEWTSLPCYNELLHNDSTAKAPSCPCRVKNCPSVETRDFYARGLFSGLDRIPSRQSTDSDSTTDSSPTNPLTMRRGDSLYDLNTQFERLVSGQESEFGEAPPAYDVIGRSPAVW